MAPPTIVLRVSLSTDRTAFVLVHVTSAGPRSLDLKLIGTDDEDVYDGQIKQTHTSSLRVPNCPCNEKEWEEILKHVMLGIDHGSSSQDLLGGVEAVAKLEKKAMVITIQKRIENIIQRLGTLELAKRSDKAATDDVDLFEWCGLAVEALQAGRDELHGLREEMASRQEDVDKLRSALTELTEAKVQQEQELLEKFALLLNEKKLRIRDQQRLLISARVDPSKVRRGDAPDAAASNAPSSRKGKRKAVDPDQMDTDSEDQDGMDVDGEDATDRKQQDTSQGETTADESEEQHVVLPPSRRRTGEKALNKSNHIGTVQHKPLTRGNAESSPAEPPPRDLPFSRKPPAPVSQAAPPAPADGPETASDEEL